MRPLKHGVQTPALLSAFQTADFEQRGFVYIEGICEPWELRVLRAVLERLFAERTGLKEGTFYDMVERDSADPPQLPTLIGPSNYCPELRGLPCQQRAATIARALLGESAVLSLEHAILKPALYGAPTPWHQDEAYRLEAGFCYRQAGFWIPLDHATVESGCLHYVPGSNLGEVLPHRSHNNNTGIYALECAIPIQEGAAVPAPVRAGDCVVHAGRTLHYAGPNRTAAPRYAYLLEFELPPRPLPTTREFSWNRDRQPPNRVMRRRWLRRGGVLIELARRLRATLFTPARLRFELRRTLSAFRRYFT